VKVTNKTRSEENKALVRSYFEAYDTGDIEAVMRFIHGRHVHHPPGGDEAMDFEERRHDDEVFFSAFSDVHTVIEDQVAEGDKVASRITMHATHTGTYHGIAATGRRIAIPFMDIARVSEGRILEEWTEFDQASILKQLTDKPQKQS
jgi:predicted ester cyclase